MLPLRFHNSGIRAKVFMRKIGFKLRVMRSNRAESFYAFLLHFCNESSVEEGWPATASPHAGPATHGQAAAKAPNKGATGCDQGQPAREVGAARRGSSRPQGRQPPAGTPACSMAPAMGCRPRLALPPVGAAALTVGVAALWHGGCRQARAVVACARVATAVAQMGQEGLGHPFEKRMILPLKF
ncbi:hypothetical protein BHM03_00018504 [Ensete ventricosum]|nr:hypothetical protein BHM03_00018504 [Ensete ventricosum]